MWRVMFLGGLVAIMALAGCNKSSSSPTGPGAANVILTGTTHNYGSNGGCQTAYNLKNVGGNTAYHVYVQDNTGAHTCYLGQIEAGGTSFANSDYVPGGPCPVFGSIHWSDAP